MLVSLGRQVQPCDSQSFQCFVYPSLRAVPLNIKANDAEGLIDDKYCCIVTLPGTHRREQFAVVLSSPCHCVII